MAKKRSQQAESIIAGLEEILDYKKGKVNLRTTNVVMPKPPKTITGAQLKKMREKELKMSQAVFAKFLAVSPETVRTWEQEKSSPSGPALRMINLARRDKESFMELFQKAS